MKLDRPTHRNSPKISSNAFFRKRRSRWTGAQSTHHASHGFNRLYRPPPTRPFIPSLEQIRLSRKAKDEEIEQSIRPEKAPLPPRLPDEDEAYVDEILRKRGVLSKAGREQVADKDIARLRPYQWLNDEVINFYGQLILSRSESQKENSTPIPAGGHCNGFVEDIKGKANGKAKKPLLDVHYFNTFFWPKLTGEGYDRGRLAKWTKKVTSNLNLRSQCMLIPCSCKDRLVLEGCDSDTH